MTGFFSQEVIGQKFSTIIYLTSEDKGVPTYFYLAVKGNKLAALKQHIKEKGSNIADYGTILESGYGKPTFEVTQRMAELYGCTPEHAISL